jgi:hypothetical protein
MARALTAPSGWMGRARSRPRLPAEVANRPRQNAASAAREPDRCGGRHIGMVHGRWLAVVLLAAGLAFASGCTSSPRGWRTYRQPPGPMRLSFRYPASWLVGGKAFVSTGGVGGVQLATGMRGSLHDMMAADCARRGAVLGPNGIDVFWSETLGATPPASLTFYRGQDVRVHGHPARWSVEASTLCFKGRIVTGVVQLAARNFVIMSADVGSAVPAKEIATLRTIFDSVRE